MRLVMKAIGVVAGVLTALAVVAAPGSAVEAQQAVSVDSVDGYYNGSVVVGTNVVKANGSIADTGFHRSSSALYINIRSSSGTYNIPFATVGNGDAYVFATRQKAFPGTFISGTATMCSWRNSGTGSVWACGTPQSIG
ncbi:hypothetical protein ACWEFJ_09995 [Actinosynnema sp. NPDC004786]